MYIIVSPSICNSIVYTYKLTLILSVSVIFCSMTDNELFRWDIFCLPKARVPFFSFPIDTLNNEVSCKTTQISIHF